MSESIHPETHELASGVYDFIKNLEPIQLFYYVCIIVASLLVFQFLEITITHISAIIIALIIIFYLDKKNKREQKTQMDNIYLKLNMIRPKPKYFYMDSDIILLIDDIKEYREYNLVAYSNLIYALDNFLEIVHDIRLGVKDIEDNIDVAMHQKRISIDNLQSMLFEIPVDRMLEYKLEKAIYNLDLMLQRHIDKMIHIQQNKIEMEGYNNRTKVYYFDHPEGLDHEKNRKYINQS